MIDTHCHLEQDSYDNDRDELVSRCREKMDAIITSDPNPETFEKTLSIAERYEGFVFPTLGIHPEYVERFHDKVDDVMDFIRDNKERIVGVGEVGLDYYYIKDPEWREKQRDMFRLFVKLANELQLPLVTHIRDGNDDENVFKHAIEILEQENASKVQLHMFGSRDYLERAIEDGFHISENSIILRSKNYKKVVRDTPLDRLMLETDAPWLHPSGDSDKRNDPLGVEKVAEKMARIKKVSIDKIINSTTENAINFYGLKI